MKSSYWKFVEEADKFFSLYIRKKAALTTTQVKCITCSHVGHWKTFDNGHYISRRQMATRFDEMNVAPQCGGCNGPGKGKPKTFRSILVFLHGEKKVKAMEKRSNKPRLYTVPELFEIKEKYKKLYYDL